MTDHAEPLPPQERIATLEFVRGFVLLGILIMNMPGFTVSMFAGMAWWSSAHRNWRCPRPLRGRGRRR